MEEIVDMNALFDVKKPGDEISSVERLVNEFEAHEAKEEQSLEQYRKIVEAYPVRYPLPTPADRVR